MESEKSENLGVENRFLEEFYTKKYLESIEPLWNDFKKIKEIFIEKLSLEDQEIFKNVFKEFKNFAT